jgi:hypothetical protein
MMEANLVLTCTSVPDCDRALAAVLEIFPQLELMMPRTPAMGRQADVDRHRNSL